MRKKQNSSNCSTKQLDSSLPEQIQQAADVLKKGGTVAFPTETCYGLAVNPFDIAAVKKLYELKGRDYSKPVLILINSDKQLFACTREIPKEYKNLINNYWPGPLTLVFPASEKIPDIISGGTKTIAIRRSSHVIANSLIDAFGLPVTATSANLSSSNKVAQTARDCLTIFTDNIDYIIDNNEKCRDSFSTIVGLSNNQLKILRQGELQLTEMTV